MKLIVFNRQGSGRCINGESVQGGSDAPLQSRLANGRFRVLYKCRLLLWADTCYSGARLDEAGQGKARPAGAQRCSQSIC